MVGTWGFTNSKTIIVEAIEVMASVKPISLFCLYSYKFHRNMRLIIIFIFGIILNFFIIIEPWDKIIDYFCSCDA